MATLLIGQNYFQKKSIINDNVDWEMIKPIIEAAQDLYLQDLIGTDLYKKLQADVVASQPPTTPIVAISANYKILLDEYVTKFLHWFVVSNMGDALKFRYMNKGVMEKNSDNSQPAATSEMKVVSQKWLGYAEQYGENLRKYVIANANLYPELSTNSGIDKNKPGGTGFNSPFYFENDYSRLSLRNDEGDFRYENYNLKKDWWKY